VRANKQKEDDEKENSQKKSRGNKGKWGRFKERRGSQTLLKNKRKLMGHASGGAEIKLEGCKISRHWEKKKRTVEGRDSVRSRGSGGKKGRWKGGEKPYRRETSTARGIEPSRL